MPESITKLVEIKNYLNVSKIGVIYSDAKREYFPTDEQYTTEKTAKEDADKIAHAIKELGLEVKTFPGNDDMVLDLKKYKPDMVFNLVDSMKGNEYLSSTIPGLLDVMDIPYTGAGLLGLALCFNKYLTKVLLQSAGIPVPNFQLFHNPNDFMDPALRYPLISKLNEIHGAVEINKDSISENENHLRDRLKYLMDTYKQPVLVEEYIAGREITALMLEGNNTKVYMAEKIFNKPDEKYLFATFDDQWSDFSDDQKTWPYTYAKYDDSNLKDIVKKAVELTRMADYAKFDVRLDQSGRYFFIDSNANPAFAPKSSTTAIGLIIEELYSIPFSEIITRLICNTMNEARNGTQEH